MIVTCLIAASFYLWGVHRYRVKRGKPWPYVRTFCFLTGVFSAWFAIASPLDDAADEYFTPHMIQHLLLTDLTAPLILLSAPLLLLLGASSQNRGRRIAKFLNRPLLQFITHPISTWLIFIVSLWAVHYSMFFEAALEHENIHILEHTLFLSTALLFWLPIIPYGTTHWRSGALSYPLRMLYLLVAMPAEAFLGLALYSQRAPLYAHYRAAGLADQQAAGEIMWVGASLVMFVAFMIVGFEWARSEERIATTSFELPSS